MAAVTICCDSGAPKIKSDTVSTVSPSIFHEVMGPDAMILVFWNVRSMNQSKLEVLKQEMQSVNIIGISELKWTGMGGFNSDDHYIYYCGQESLRRNGVVLTINIRVQNAALGCSLKSNRMISVYKAKHLISQ